jgi:hypothetical protein
VHVVGQLKHYFFHNIRQLAVVKSVDAELITVHIQIFSYVALNVHGMKKVIKINYVSTLWHFLWYFMAYKFCCMVTSCVKNEKVLFQHNVK